MRTLVIIAPEPFRGKLLGLIDRPEDMLLQPFVARSPVEPFDVCVLCRMSGLRVQSIRPTNCIVEKRFVSPNFEQTQDSKETEWI